MKHELLRLLRCPITGQKLKYLDICGEYLEPTEEIYEGWLITIDGKYRYPIKNAIPRFVPESNYANNFGLQWNKFCKTQLDSYSGSSVSKDRFYNATNWSPDILRGQYVLDVGCGSGRFAEIALKTGAHVVALDYSSAVDACYENFKDYPNFHVVQADIYSLPFEKGVFPFVYSLGVLQHTPNVKKAFFSLLPMLALQGQICVDFYEKSWKSILHLKYWIRPITKRVDQVKLFNLLEYLVPKLLIVSIFLNNIPMLGKYLKFIVPVANHKKLLPLSTQQHIQWSLLDTFDWLSPEFDNPQSKKTVTSWFEEAKFSTKEILRAGHLVGRGKIL